MVEHMQNPHPHRPLGENAADRHGVFSLSDAVGLGVPRSTVSRRTAAGLYRRLRPSVYAYVAAPASMHQNIVAAVASFHDLAAASHQTAAELWGLTKRGIRRIEIVTTRWDRVHRPDIRVHESLDLIPADVTEWNGIPVTTPVRTVVDLGASNRWLVEAALSEGIRLRLFTLAEVEAFVARVARRGRRGVGVIRPLLEARHRQAAVTESVLEDLFLKVVHEGGLPLPVAQFVVRDHDGRFVCRADFAYPQHRVLIELDGAAFHQDDVSFRRDRVKQNRAAVLGWTVLRYTWYDVQETPARIWIEIQMAMRAGA
jgi:hypothetical protein